jgi:serine phosphatase RsbU (regulator of sigma subunit)
VCLIVTLKPDVALVELACAGHPAPIFVPADGTPGAVPTHGDLLGVFPTVRLQTAELELHRGDSVVAYTDGVTDQGPETRISPEQALREQTGTHAEALASTLEQLAQRPIGPHPDDVAILAFRFLGQEPARDVPPRAAALAS